MAKSKSPFRGFTEAEVNRAEKNSYVVRIGNDMYRKDGKYIFSMAQAEHHYETLLENILYTIENGEAKQRNAALKCLANFYIQPFRLQ